MEGQSPIFFYCVAQGVTSPKCTLLAKKIPKFSSFMCLSEAFGFGSDKPGNWSYPLWCVQKRFQAFSLHFDQTLGLTPEIGRGHAKCSISQPSFSCLTHAFDQGCCQTLSHASLCEEPLLLAPSHRLRLLLPSSQDPYPLTSLCGGLVFHQSHVHHTWLALGSAKTLSH